MTGASSQKCYLCGGVDHQRRPGRVRDAANLDILECQSCGLVFLSKGAIPDGFYEGSGMHGVELQPIDAWLRETDRDDERRFRDLSEAMTNRDVLDFGCGAGGFMLKARQKARTITGIELETRLEPHHRASGLKVVRGLNELPTDGRFDLITAFHVVEHLEDPVEMLQQLSCKLRSGSGRMVVEVPSSADALLTLYKSGPFSEFTYWSCHLYLFNAANLLRLATKAGLKLDYVRHIQRYPLSNHLHWLARGKPGGHQAWAFIDDAELSRAYEARLAALGLSDTLFAGFSVPTNE